MANQRKLKNFLISPQFQLKFSTLLISSTLVALVTFFLSIYLMLAKMIMTLAASNEAQSEIIDSIQGHLIWAGVLFAIVTIAVSGIVFFFSVIYTHRLLGPIVPIKRHIHSLIEGDFSIRTRLRKKDELNDVAELLNQLSEKLENQKSKLEH